MIRFSSYLAPKGDFMITSNELISFINHKSFTSELASECIEVYSKNNTQLDIDELGNVFQKENHSAFDDFELLNPSAVIEFYKEHLVEILNDSIDYGDKVNELRKKIELLDDIQDYCVSREENETEFEREITYSNKLKLDLDQGFWTSSDSFKTKIHISTNFISDDYVRLITNYENRDVKVKNYIDNLIDANPNESYIIISINPTTKEIEFTLNSINNVNLTNYLNYDYKFQLIKDLSKLLYNIDTIDNSKTNEYKQQIGSNFEKYKEIVDSVIIIEKIEWKNFSKKSFELLKKEILSGDVEEGFIGKLDCGALSIEFHQHDKEYDFVDFDYYILGEEGEGENYNVPYCYETGETINHQLIKENNYETFKKEFVNIFFEEINKHQFLREATKYNTVDWENEKEVKDFYLNYLSDKRRTFYKSDIANIDVAITLTTIINTLEPALNFKKSDTEIVLNYLVADDFLCFENNTLTYKDDNDTYGKTVLDVLEYIKANIEERIENIKMNIDDGYNIEEEQEYLKIVEEQELLPIQNKCNFLRLKEIFKDKTYTINFYNDKRIYNFEDLFIYNREKLEIRNESELIYETAFSMVYNRLESFGYFTPDNFDKLFDIDATNIDAKDIRCDLVDGAINKLIEGKLNSFDEIQEFVIKTSKEVFKNECLKELEKQTFLDDVEKIVDLSIDSLDKDDYLDTYSYVTEEEYDRTKYLFENFYKTENQTGSIDLKALYDSKESVDNVVTLENGAEIRKVIESDEGEEREYYDLYDKDICSICDGENYEVKAVIDGTYYLKGLDSEYEDSGFALSTDEYLIATKQQNQGKELGITEDDYKELADKICQAAYEDSASGFYCSFDLDEIATLADRDIDWVKTHIEKIGEALVEHNDELLLDFNPSENINLEENQIEFNFCSVGEDANELFKCVEGRWERKTNRELEADGYIIPVDIKYSFTYKPNLSVRDEQQVLVDSICDLFIEDSEIIDKKVNSLPGGKFNIEFILRHDFAIEPGTDYFNLKYDNINDRILYEMNNIIKNNEKLHCFTIDSIKSFIPEEFHIRKNLVLINDETIERFSKIPEEYLKELNPEMVSFAGSSMWREEDYFISDKNNFVEIMEKYPAIKNYVEKKWDLLKEKSLQLEKKVEVLWNKGILLFKGTKYWEDILTETPADSKENDSFILSKLHSKFRQEIVDKFNPNENINWENESWNYICETMQRKSLDYDYSVNYNNGLTSKDLQDFIAYNFITIKMNLQDKEMESLWEKLEDIPFIEDEDGRLILDSDEPWHNFAPGTTKEEIWHYFDRNHSKGINYLVNEYESKTKELQEQSKKEGYEAGYSGEYEPNDLTQEEQESQMYKKIYTKDSDGFEEWTEYDNKGNIIHFKDSEGFEKWYEYNDKGNVIHFKDSEGLEEWIEYDNKGNQIHFKNSYGFETWTEYDDKGHEIHFKRSTGHETWSEYDEKGNKIHSKDSYGVECWIDYDDKGNEIHFKNSNGYEEWNEYDNKGHIIHFKDNASIEYWQEYDDKGNKIHFKDSKGYEKWTEYDSNGNEIHLKNSNGYETWSTIEYVSKEQYLQEKVEQTKKVGFEKEIKQAIDLDLEEQNQTLKPLQIIEKIELNPEIEFRDLLLDKLKISKDPFEATFRIFEELKQKNDTKKIQRFNKYLEDNNCKTKKGFEKFFIEIIGLTKKEPKKTQNKEFDGFYSLKR